MSITQIPVHTRVMILSPTFWQGRSTCSQLRDADQILLPGRHSPGFPRVCALSIRTKSCGTCDGVLRPREYRGQPSLSRWHANVEPNGAVLRDAFASWRCGGRFFWPRARAQPLVHGTGSRGVDHQREADNPRHLPPRHHGSRTHAATIARTQGHGRVRRQAA